MSRKLTTVAAAVALVLSTASASAFEFEDVFTVRGYATVGVAHSSTDQADFVNSRFLQNTGVGFTEDYWTGLDSKAGVQIDMRFSDRWSAVVQVISQDSYGNSWDGSTVVDAYKPSLEWANVSFKATDNLTIRAGRVVLPFLMRSDSQKVGYANHWLRAPLEVYGELPFTTSDGGDATYRTTIGSAINTIGAHYGVMTHVREGGNNDVTVWGANDTLEIGSLLVRAAYVNLETQANNADLTNLFGGFAGLAGALGQFEAAQEAVRLQSIYDVALKQSVSLINLGASYDANSWFVLGEVNRVASDGIQVGSLGGYIGGGLRIGAFTPYATLSRAKSTHRDERLVPLEGLAAMAGQPLPPPVAGMVQGALGMGAGINGFVGSVLADNGQTTSSLGLRWDFISNFALKMQVDHIDVDSGSTGRFVIPAPPLQSDFEPGSKVNLYSVAVDYIF